MFIYNVHAPCKTFALAAKDKESAEDLTGRILKKSGLRPEEVDAVRQQREGAGIVYEFEGHRWALEDDDDLAIVEARFRTEKESNPTPSITLHVVLPGESHRNVPVSPMSAAANGRAISNGRARDSSVPPPAYQSASAQLQARTQRKNKKATKGTVHPVNGHGDAASIAESTGAFTFTSVRKKDPLTAAMAVGIPNASKARSVSRARSVRSTFSTRSRRSKWGDDDAEPLGDVKRREWEEFHANNGVRTVVGKVGNVDNVRMLLKQGYKGVYLSRAFAARHGLIPHKQRPGVSGHMGLRVLGNVPITVGGKMAYHPAMLSEEQHFDVVLGRSWLEKMNIKVDPLDPTALTYMDSGETIPCDLVVLRDANGEIVTIT